MRIFVWLFRALVFFTLFAFALNNQHAGVVRWFFGLEWQAPMVFIVLAAFATGCAIGVVAMLPGWWRRRRAAPPPPPAAAPAPLAMAGAEAGPSHPPRDGL
jgi:uncharacterized integral membrane protein